RAGRREDGPPSRVVQRLQQGRGHARHPRRRRRHRARRRAGTGDGSAGGALRSCAARTRSPSRSRPSCGLQERIMSFQRAAAWASGGASDRTIRAETRVRRGFWPKVGRVAARLPFAEDFLAAYYCAFDRATPLQVRAALLAALAYFVLPFDFIPDLLPLVGYADDAAVLLTALRLVSSHMRDEHRIAAREALARMRERRV